MAHYRRMKSENVNIEYVSSAPCCRQDQLTVPLSEPVVTVSPISMDHFLTSNTT